VSFKETCPFVDISFELVNDSNSYFPEILIVKVNGKYRDGSAGDDDAILIRGMIRAADDLWKPQSLLIDLREFQYDWGDYIDIVIDNGEITKHTAVIVGPKCREALSTLLYGLGTEKDFVDNIDHFDDIELAIASLKSRIFEKK
jgi:hypothetical protein